MSEPDWQWCGDSLAHWARTTPERVGLSDPDHCMTFAELDRSVDRSVRVFRRFGAVPGDRILVVCENSVAAACALLAAQRMRAWAVPVNARLTGAEVDRIIAHATPRLAVVTDAVSAEAAAHARRLGTAEPFGWGAHLGRLAGAGAPAPVRDDPARQVAALLYTTGTTGAPKGVMLTHRNLTAAAAQIAEARGANPDDRVCCPLPISHIFGLSAVLGVAISIGYRVDFTPRFDPAAVLRSFAEDGITAFSGVPAMFAALVAQGEREGVSAPRLRSLSSGGAPLDPGLKDQVEALFALPLGNGYGLTETAPAGCVVRPGIYGAGTSVGPATPGTELRIAGPDGQALPPDVIGEVWLRGPTVMLGYYRSPELTQAALTADGWLRTGDLGQADTRGWLTISGRAKELIIRSGFNVYPPEIEGVLTKCAGVALAAVVGREEMGNEVPVAFLQPRPGETIDLASVRTGVEEALAPYKRPASYHVFAALPAAATGKVLKHKLLEMLEERDGPGTETDM